MSRFVRPSKYRHVFAQQSKKEFAYENLKITNSAWDTNLVATSAQYISVNWNASGGGAFAILPLPTPFGAPVGVGAAGFPTKLPDTLPLARGHTAPVLDTDWAPHDDTLVASAGEDGKVLLWSVDAQTFEGWGLEGWTPSDFDPVLRIDASPRKIGQVLWHPTTKGMLLSASGEHSVKVWDIAAPESPIAVFGDGEHADAIQSMALDDAGSVVATTCRDRKLRVFDLRAGQNAVKITESHTGIKPSRLTFMGSLPKIATTGFSKMSDRQVGVWDLRMIGSSSGKANERMISLDQSAGVVMPFWSDNGILFLAGKGDGNIRYYEYDSDSLHALSEHKSSDPQRGMCFLPRRALNVAECEIARAYKVISNGVVEPIGFIVPRKADSFQSDIYPPAPSGEPYFSTPREFFNAPKLGRKIVDLSNGKSQSVDAGAALPLPGPTPITSPTPSFSAPPPQPQAIPVSTPSPVVVSSPSPVTKSYSEPQPTRKDSSRIEKEAMDIDVAPSPVPLNDSAELATLRSENASIKAELREARELIRNLELKVEGLRTNAKKAAEVLGL